MEDTVEDVKRKIKKAYCPPVEVEGNPIMDYAKNIIFGYYGTLTVLIEGVSTRCFILYCILFVVC